MAFFIQQNKQYYTAVVLKLQSKTSLKITKMKLGLNALSVWFGMIMILVVLSAAIAFSFTNVMSDRLFGAKRTGFIVMLFAYAVYRGFRLSQTLKQNKNEE